MPPCPPASLCELFGHAPLEGIAMETHGGADADEFAADGPYFLAVRLAEGEIVATDE